MGNSPALNVAKKAGRFTLSVLLVISMAATFLCCFVKYVFLNRTKYIQAAESPAFLEAVNTAVSETLEAECLFYDLPFETIQTAISEEQIKTTVTSYMVSVYDSLCTGKTLSSVSVDSSLFQAAIDSFFTSLPESERPLDVNASKTIAEDLSKAIAPVLQAGLNDSLVSKGHVVFSATSPLRKIADFSVVFVVLTVVLAVAHWFLGEANRAQRTYSTAGVLLLGCSSVLVPLWLLRWYDLPSRLVLGESSLKQYVNGVLYTTLDNAHTMVLIPFIVCAVLLIVSVIWLIRLSVKEKE